MYFATKRNSRVNDLKVVREKNRLRKLTLQIKHGR